MPPHSTKERFLGTVQNSLGEQITNSNELRSRNFALLGEYKGCRLSLHGDYEREVFQLKENDNLGTYCKSGTDWTFAEFFAGIGLVRMGLQKAGWRVVYANDFDPLKKQMYDAQFGNSDSYYDTRDIREIHGYEIPNVMLATASFPCTDLSLAGGRGGLQGVQSSAFWEFVRILKEMGPRKPPYLLIENVPGFLTSHKGKDFRCAMFALNELGYSVDPRIIDAAEFVPQSRKRMFIVGVIDGKTETKLCPLLALETDSRPKALARFMNLHTDIVWRGRELPSLPQRLNSLESILEDLPHAAPEWWSSDRVEYLLSQMSPRHLKIAESMMKKSEWHYGTVFRRTRAGKSTAELRTDGIAGCLRTPKGGSAKQILFKAGKGEYLARLITPKEAARLMGAGEFNIDVTNDQALFGFGDAVCVPVVEWLANNYLNEELLENKNTNTKQLEEVSS